MEWKVLVIEDQEPLAFGQRLEEVLQTLSNDGFAVVSQMPRDTAYVVVGRRISTGDHAADTLPPGPPEPAHRREPPSPFAASGVNHAEAIYYFKEGDLIRHRAFDVLNDAVHLLREHLASETILPVKIVFARTTQFEPSSFAFLLRTFTDALKPEPAS